MRTTRRQNSQPWKRRALRMRRNFDCKLPGENMNDKRPPEAPFHAGEPVFLALGPCQPPAIHGAV
jgi:hypothetical protein